MRGTPQNFFTPEWRWWAALAMARMGDQVKSQVDCMLEQLKTMEGNLARLSKGDLRLPVHRMELQRIRSP